MRNTESSSHKCQRTFNRCETATGNVSPQLSIASNYYTVTASQTIRYTTERAPIQKNLRRGISTKCWSKKKLDPHRRSGPHEFYSHPRKTRPPDSAWNIECYTLSQNATHILSHGWIIASIPRLRRNLFHPRRKKRILVEKIREIGRSQNRKYVSLRTVLIHLHAIRTAECIWNLQRTNDVILETIK